jgi:hypothetical protein
MNMTNDDWVSGFQILMVILLIAGVCVLIAHDIKVDHQKCIQDGGQWVHGMSTSGNYQYYCIEPKGF